MHYTFKIERNGSWLQVWDTASGNTVLQVNVSYISHQVILVVIANVLGLETE